MVVDGERWMGGGDMELALGWAVRLAGVTVLVRAPFSEMDPGPGEA